VGIFRPRLVILSGTTCSEEFVRDYFHCLIECRESHVAFEERSSELQGGVLLSVIASRVQRGVAIWLWTTNPFFVIPRSNAFATWESHFRRVILSAAKNLFLTKKELEVLGELK